VARLVVVVAGEEEGMVVFAAGVRRDMVLGGSGIATHSHMRHTLVRDLRGILPSAGPIINDVSQPP
jgi:hypothetical protein